MSEPFVGEIRMFAGNFAPRAWAFCDGQLLPVSQNDALFSLFGTIYGGDGRTTFGLPDMRGRIPLHQGQGPGLSLRRIGSKSGAERVSLTTNQLASHSHDLNANPATAAESNPAGSVLADPNPGGRLYDQVTQDASAAATSITNTGGSQPHNNMMPTLCVNFIVALFGIYPSRQ